MPGVPQRVTKTAQRTSEVGWVLEALVRKARSPSNPLHQDMGVVSQPFIWNRKMFTMYCLELVGCSPRAYTALWRPTHDQAHIFFFVDHLTPSRSRLFGVGIARRKLTWRGKPDFYPFVQAPRISSCAPAHYTRRYEARPYLVLPFSLAIFTHCVTTNRNRRCGAAFQEGGEYSCFETLIDSMMMTRRRMYIH